MKKKNAECINRVRIHAFSVLILLLMMAGCDNVTSPDTSTNVHKTEQNLETADALNTISDGVHGGSEGFYFLPPMVKSPDYSGDFDGSLSPVVEICKTTACSDFHASYSMTEGTGSELVRLVEEDEHYIVNWHTGETEAVADQTYRVRVRVAGTVLGYANVAVVSTGREAVAVRSDGSIALVVNQTLPVKFRIETGIVGAVVVSPAEATIDVGTSQHFTAVLYDLHGQPLDGHAVTWTSDETGVATVDAEGLATGVAIGLTTITASSGIVSGSASLEVTSGDPGTLIGRIVNALNGQAIQGVYVDLGGDNNTTTNVDGRFSLEVLEGEYSASISMSGYVTTEISNVQVLGGEITDLGNIALSPALSLGEVRIVLTWGETPRDLDAYLTGPIPGSTSRFRVWYSNRGSLYSSPFAFLDRDVTNSYGPETVTISQRFDGVYRFSVHDYTNGWSSSSIALGNSNASVRVFNETGQVAEFFVPAEPGTLWTVFELDGLSGTITPIDVMTFSSGGYNIMSIAQQTDHDEIDAGTSTNPKP